MSTQAPYLRVDDVTFTQSQWEECDVEHDTPLFGCPVCFLFLAEKEPYAEMGMLAVQQILSLEDADVESLKYARAMLADIASIPVRVRAHLRGPTQGGAA